MLAKNFKVILVVAVIALASVLGGSGSIARFHPGKTPIYLSFTQRLVTSYLIESVGQPIEKKRELLQRFSSVVRSLAQRPKEPVFVNSFEDYQRLNRGLWPDSHSLQADLEIIEQSIPKINTEVFGANSDVQAEIDAYEERQRDFLLKMSGQFALDSYQLIVDMLLNNDLLGIEKLVNANSNLLEMIFDRQLQDMRNVGNEMSAQIQKESNSPVAISRLLAEVMRQYYSRLSLSSKKQFFSQFIGGDLQMKPLEKFSIMVQNSGPQFQKLLQIIAREFSGSHKLSFVFKTLESRIRPVPPVLVERILESYRSDFNWVSYQMKPLGVGTMAQIHRGKIKTPGGIKSVAIRFLKPGIQERVYEDKRILAEMAPILDQDISLKRAGLPSVTPLVEDLAISIEQELQIVQTIARQKSGAIAYNHTRLFKGKYYKTDLEFHVPYIYVSGSSHVLMVQELVAGKSLDNVLNEWSDLVPDLKRVVIEEMAAVWLEEVLFRSGFYHSDLHQGNFLVDITTERIRVEILDFGMGGFLPVNIRELLLYLSVGLEALDAEVITEAFWEISRKQENSIRFSDFRSLVLRQVNWIRTGVMADRTTDQWSTWAMNQGLRFPQEFIGLNRGLLIFEGLLRNTNSDLNMYKIGKRLVIKNAWRSIKTIKGVGVHTWSEVIRLGYSAFRRPIQLPATKSCRSVLSGH